MLLSFHRYYTSFVSLMAHKYKEVFAASAEVLGMVLAYMDEKKDVSYTPLIQNLILSMLIMFYMLVHFGDSGRSDC